MAKNKFNLLPIILSVVFLFLIISTIFLLKSIKNKQEPICNNISIKVVEKNNQKILCIFPDYSKIQMILQNNGNEKIDKIEIILKGENLKKNISNINLMPEQVFTKVIEANEKIDEITLIPIKTIKKDSIEKDIKCSPVNYNEIKFC